MGKLVAEGWLGDRIHQEPQWYMGTLTWAPEDLGASYVWHMPERACGCVHAKLLSRVWLCNLMDCSSPGYSVHGIFQAKILEWVTVPSSRESSPPRDRTCVSCLLHWQAGSFFTTSTTWEAQRAWLRVFVNLEAVLEGESMSETCSIWGEPSHLLPFPHLLMWLVPLPAELTLWMHHPCRCSIISTFSLFPASQQFTL